MDCIDLFKKAAAALQTDPRYLELDAARRENDMDEGREAVGAHSICARSHCTQPHTFRVDMESAPTRTTYQLESTGV